MAKNIETKSNDLPEPLPAHLQDSMDMGNENLSSDSVIMPRLALLQQLSPELNENEPEYVPHAAVGELINTLTKETYPSANLINLYFVKNWMVVKKRIEGGGFFGMYNSAEDAVAFINSQENPEVFEIVDTHSHYCLMLNEELDDAECILLPMTSTKLKVSRAWNTMISRKRVARFGCSWIIGTCQEKNKKGSYYNLKIDSDGDYLDKAWFEKAKKHYDSIHESYMRSLVPQATPKALADTEEQN